MTRFMRSLADSRRPGSLGDRFRQRRFVVFRDLVDSVDRPVRILDVGGTVSFWERLGYAGVSGYEITLFNVVPQDVQYANMSATVGNAIDLSRYGDKTFDVLVSNSVVEHLPTKELQARMIAECRRVGRRVYFQTPNRYFPMEPHFLFPFFAVLPIGIRAWLLQHMDLGWHPRQPDRVAALADVRSTRLMSGKELRELFPGDDIVPERVLLFTKSFVVLAGWDTEGAG
jgi:SAM-dependent methyltransferase